MNKSQMNQPFVKIILGPMTSGKSSELIRLIKRQRTINTPLMIINHTSDVRYSNDSVSTHDKISEKAVCVSELFNVLEMEEYKKSKIIFIEEGQFFPDLYNFVINACEKDNKSIVIAGLDGDYKREPFGDMLRLIPIADEVTKIHALCKMCNDGTIASFTKRIVNSDNKVLIGGTESYQAVCRKHFMEN